MNVDSTIHTYLKNIKDNDGFLGTIPNIVRERLLSSGWAIVELSPVSGLDFQWFMTSDGKKELRNRSAIQRRNKKTRGKPYFDRGVNFREDSVVPLTVEVLDALKSIMETGEPGTTKLDILARIQKSGTHAVNQILRVGGYLNLYGSLAKLKDYKWTLTKAGEELAAAHIRKKECAQFSGNVR